MSAQRGSSIGKRCVTVEITMDDTSGIREERTCAGGPEIAVGEDI